jgi:hypothetical protein
MNPNGDSQQRQICCVVIAIKRVWQKRVFGKEEFEFGRNGWG